MTLLDLKKNMFQCLSIDKTEIESFFYILIEHRLHLSKVDFLMNPNVIISQVDKDFFSAVLLRLKNEEPIQYILNQTFFYSLLFEVDENTLIPRPETEELVEWIIKDQVLLKKKDLRILDIGTGSGCIPIALSKNISNSVVTTVDVSEKAIQVAKRNAKTNKVEVCFINDTILAPETINNTKYVFDVIVSNPPYVRNLEKQDIKNNVLAYEPHLALFVADDDALIFYDRITKYALKHLKKDGVLYFEINQYLGVATVELVKKIGFKNVQLRKDMFGNDRMIKAFGF
jgi:release factor glutamine methyltransferase